MFNEIIKKTLHFFVFFVFVVGYNQDQRDEG
jgi:hypothetical protein